jgi:undecaprenyl diphosphate synthase
LSLKRIPRHIGIIPDGNRRWAVERGLSKEAGYNAGLAPGLALFRLAKKEGIKELTFYGFTQDNVKRPREQVKAFKSSCVDAVGIISNEDASLLIVGNSNSPVFPKELLPYTKRTDSVSGFERRNGRAQWWEGKFHRENSIFRYFEIGSHNTLGWQKKTQRLPACSIRLRRFLYN